MVAGGTPEEASVELVSLDPSRPVPSCLQGLPLIPNGGRDYPAGGAALNPGEN